MQTEDYVIERSAKGWVVASRGNSILICARRKVAEVAVRTATKALEKTSSPVFCRFRKLCRWASGRGKRAA